MPEILEVELSRQAITKVIGRTVLAIERTDPIIVAPGVDDVLPGHTVTGVGRRGKLMVVHTDGPDLGVHYGMTGRLLRDGDEPAVERLAYSANSDHERWDRWVARLDDGTRLRFHDPRRFGHLWLDPDVDLLGPDALTLRRRDLAAALGRRRAPVKAVLLDQAAVAGLGNLLVDEVLWWSGIDPRRIAASLEPDEVTRLHRAVRRRLPVMMRRGGSHTGMLSPSLRASSGRCARDGTPLERAAVGGRTTVWCPSHQR